MKITKDDLRTIINEVLEEGQWYDIKVKGAGSKKKKAAKKSKRVKKMPNIPGQPGGSRAKSVATMEEGGEIHQDPTEKDCADWKDLIAIAKALDMSDSAIDALEKKAGESGCAEVLDEHDDGDDDGGPFHQKGEAMVQASEGGPTDPLYKIDT